MKNYLMSGGATGIGAAIKTLLRAAGHNVVVMDVKDADITVDLADPASRSAAIAQARSHFSGGLDGVITCAGVASHFPDTGKIISINYFGTTELVDGVADLLTAGGRVVLISSNSAPMCQAPDLVEAMLGNDESIAVAAAADHTGHNCYSGSKQAVARWMKAVSGGFAKRGITINAVAPGYIETPMTASVAADPNYGDSIRQFVESIPAGRAGLPSDIANLVEFLLSDKAGFICGSLIFIDGGHDAMFRPNAI